MFSVYGVSCSFCCSMEQLRHIGPVSSVARSNAIEPLGCYGGTSGAFKTLLGQSSPAGGGDEAHRNMLSAYEQTQKVVMPRHPLSRRTGASMSRSHHHTGWFHRAGGLEILAQHGVGQAPVVNGLGTLVGLLSRADLLRPERLPKPDSSALVWRALLAQSVQDMMSTPVPCVAPDTTFGGLPAFCWILIWRVCRWWMTVGVVTGFVSRLDILRAVVTSHSIVGISACFIQCHW